MFRMTLLCLALGPLAQVLPQGCPLAPAPEPLPTERDTIITEASAPESAAVGEIVTLTASATADIDGGPISYSWLQIEGPGAKITNARRADASFVAPSLATDRTLRFMVTTTNERGDAGRADAAVLVLADAAFGQAQEEDTTAAPVARAGVDQEVPALQTVTLDGSNSRGDELTYHWRQLSGTTVELADADTVRATFTAPEYDAGGENQLEFELEVRDIRGRRDADRIVVTITEATSDDSDPRPRLRFETSMGDFVVELDREKAPITVANFLEYVDEDFYDGTIFHRVIADFVIQGGGFEPGLERKETDRDPITNESDNGLNNERGTIAMARTSDPDSATSQFYVNLSDNPSLDYQPGAPGYAVFGRVVLGMSVVDAIGAVETGPQQGFNDVPLEDVLLQDVIRISQVAVPPSSSGE